MLYFYIGQKTEWFDSLGRRRSALEDLEFLTPSARAALATEASSEFTAWEMGILISSPGPPQAKPQRIQLSDAAPLELFPVGAQDAPQYALLLMPLWAEVVRWLVGHAPAYFVCADSFWSPDHRKWVDIQMAITQGFLTPPPFQLKKIGQRDRYGAWAAGDRIAAFVRSWWPSGLGMLAGLSLKEDVGVLTQPVSDLSAITPSLLPNLRLYFQTSRSFDNLGLTGIAQQLNWQSLFSQLIKLGWTTDSQISGTPSLPVLLQHTKDKTR